MQLPEDFPRRRSRVPTVSQNAWASITLGAFICFQCSGIHRNLGTHLTKVRSLNLDSWNDDWVANMEKWGNNKVNAFWEAKRPPRRPSLEDSNSQNHIHKAFIRDKYENKLYAAGNSPEEWFQANGGSVPSAPAPAQQASAPARAPAQQAPAQAQRRPAPAPAPAPAPVRMPAKKESAPDLFSFDEPVAAPSNGGGGGDAFAAFETAGGNGGNGGFGDFGGGNGGAFDVSVRARLRQLPRPEAVKPWPPCTRSCAFAPLPAPLLPCLHPSLALRRSRAPLPA